MLNFCQGSVVSSDADNGTSKNDTFLVHAGNTIISV